MQTRYFVWADGIIYRPNNADHALEVYESLSARKKMLMTLEPFQIKKFQNMIVRERIRAVATIGREEKYDVD